MARLTRLGKRAYRDDEEPDFEDLSPYAPYSETINNCNACDGTHLKGECPATPSY